MTVGVHAAPRLAPTQDQDLFALPLWFARGLVVVVSGVISFGGFGLAMAVAGHYSVGLVFPVGALGTILLALLGWPRRAEAPDGGRAISLPSVGMCLLALVFALWNGLLAGHHVLVDRDPGVYAAAGKWIAEHGNLEVPGSQGWVIPGIPLNWSSAGMYPEPGGRLEFQFDHLASVLFAEANAIGGNRAMFAAPAVLGALALCAVYAVGCRLIGRPWLVLVSVAALAVCLPELSVARDTYSETSAQLLLWSGLWLLLRAYERRRLLVGLVAGLAMGGTMMSRVDALVYLIPLPFMAMVVWLAARSPERRRFLARLYGLVLIGALPPVVLATIDVRSRAGGYYTALHTQVRELQLGFAASVIGAILLAALWLPLGRLWQWGVRRRDGLGWALAAVAVIGLLLAWAVRPAFPGHGAASAGTAAVQKAAGLPIDPTRSYSELTMVWLSWYIGAVLLALAVAGVGIMLYRLVRDPDPAVLLLVTIAGIGTALYIVTPQITPEQIWAMRRYVPAALPFLLLAAGYAVDVGLTRVAPLLGRFRASRLVPIGIAVALLAFPIGATLPVARFTNQSGFLPALQKACAMMGPNSAVMFADADVLHIELPQTMRSYCDIQAAFVAKPLTPAQLQTVAASWKARGGTLWVMASSPALAADVAPGVTPTFVAAAVNTRRLEYTVNRPTSAYTTESFSIYLAKIAP